MKLNLRPFAIVLCLVIISFAYQNCSSRIAASAIRPVGSAVQSASTSGASTETTTAGSGSTSTGSSNAGASTSGATTSGSTASGSNGSASTGSSGTTTTAGSAGSGSSGTGCSSSGPREPASTASSSAAPVICDPLTSHDSCSGSAAAPGGEGLIGNLYSLQDGSGKKVDDYINRGKKLNALILMSQLNIPNHAWTEGFSDGGHLLHDENSSVLVEYFALDLRGYLKLPSGMTAGNYQLAVASDDGALVDLNGQTAINNDGTHPVQWSCSANMVSLNAQSKIPLRVRYYQGPRYYIALQMYWRPADYRNRPCNDNGGWQLIPTQAFTHD